MTDPFTQIFEVRQRELEYRIQEGQFSPLLVHHVILLYACPIIALLLPRRSSPYIQNAQYSILVAQLALGIWIISSCRTVSGGNGFVVGFWVGCLCLRSATLVLFNDPQEHFARLERRAVLDTEPRNNTSHAYLEVPYAQEETSSQVREVLVWQRYPGSLHHRMGWIFNMMFSFRGCEWNWGIKNTDFKVPKIVSEHQHPDAELEIARANITSESAYAFLTERTWALLKTYILLDMLSVLAPYDPYFLGNVHDRSSPLGLTGLDMVPESVIHTYQLLACSFCLKVYMELLTWFTHTICLVLSVFYPQNARSLTVVPLDVPWLYPALIGPCHSVLEEGLQGFWGGYWHQLFRIDFASCSRWITSLLPLRLSRRVFKVQYLVVPFFLSAIVHMLGSYTQLAETHPKDILVFNLLQPLGIIIQQTWCSAILPKIATQNKLPRSLRRLANTLFTAAWLIWTSSYVIDCYVGGGLYVLEALPISPLRALGIGGNKWLRWDVFPFQIWRGGTLWKSGIRIF